MTASGEGSVSSALTETAVSEAMHKGLFTCAADTPLSSAAQTMTGERIAGMEFLTVDADESLERAAQMMADHELTHLIVLDPQSAKAIGVLSTHDLAGAIASEGL
ncbi:MAG TPA: CBS domain-containing protein [Solirubrobacterales bacterium]